MPNLSLKALTNCHYELVVFVRNHLHDICPLLLQEKILNRRRYQQVSDIKSILSDEDKAKIVVQALSQNVEEDERYFNKFMGILTQHYSNSKITGLLKSAESALKSAESALKSAQSANTPEG